MDAGTLSMTYVFRLQPSSEPWRTQQGSLGSVGFSTVIVGIVLVALIGLIGFMIVGPSFFFILVYFFAKIIWIVYGIIILLLAYAAAVLSRLIIPRRRAAEPSANFLVVEESGLHLPARRSRKHFVAWDAIEIVVWRPGRLAVVCAGEPPLYFEVEASADFNAEAFTEFCRRRAAGPQR